MARLVGRTTLRLSGSGAFLDVREEEEEAQEEDETADGVTTFVKAIRTWRFTLVVRRRGGCAASGSVMSWRRYCCRRAVMGSCIPHGYLRGSIERTYRILVFQCGHCHLHPYNSTVPVVESV